MAGSRATIRAGVEIDGPDLSEITPWDEVAMRGLCEQTNAMVLVRAQRDRQLATGASMDSVPYSTKATTISFKSETSRRLKAKGGEPSVNKAGVETGRRYEGGYAQYKRDSRGVGHAAPADLRAPVRRAAGVRARADRRDQKLKRPRRARHPAVKRPAA